MQPIKLAATPVDAGKRLDHFLAGQLPHFSRSRLQSWVKAGRVFVAGRPAKSSLLLKGGELIRVEPLELPPIEARAEPIPLDILYEDEDLVAVNKPAGMVVHSGAGNYSGTLVNALLHRFGSLSTVAGNERPGIVHRLDRFTSGVLVVARTDAAHRALAHQFAHRQVEKRYLALVHGLLKNDHGLVEKPISRDPIRRIKMTAQKRRGREARSEYQVLKRFQRFSYLEVRITTGRTHQIRVHMSSIGHPIVGDRLYGAPATVEGMPPLGRYFLHAWRLRIASPATGNPLLLEAPLPVELEEWMRRLL
jgi:23S rRNA pseudouridine1911/1915/1917 synthase